MPIAELLVIGQYKTIHNGPAAQQRRSGFFYSVTLDHGGVARGGLSASSLMFC
jgi:hypothetical protein